MASTSVENTESTNDSSTVKVIHHEKGDSCVILWYIDHFNSCVSDVMCLETPIFSVNARSGLQWRLIMHFRKAMEPDFIGVSLKAVTDIPSDLRITCKIVVQENDGRLYDAMLCFVKVSKLTVNELHIPQLISKLFLKVNEQRFLTNDTLLLRCELNIESYEASPEYFSSAEHYRKILEKDMICRLMNRLHRARIYSDFTLSFVEQDVKIHRSVLSARSPVFFGFFSSLLDLQTKKYFYDMGKDVALALLLYVYTGNPYDIGCIPLGLNKEAIRYHFPLLKSFTEPNKVTFRSRIKAQKMELSLKVKNFLKQPCNRRNFVSCDFHIGDDFRSNWSLFLDLSALNWIDFRLRKMSCPPVLFNFELQIFAFNDHSCQLLNAQTLQSDSCTPQTHSFSLWINSLQSDGFIPDNTLNLKIVMRLSYSNVEEYGEQFERTFSSEICGYEQTMPPDFVRLKTDVLKMCYSKLYPSLNLISNADEAFFVHKFMVGLHSPLLMNYLDSNPQVPHIKLPEVSTSTVELITRFMYSGFLCNLRLDAAENLLHAAKKYEMTYLRQEILDLLRKNLNETNSHQIFNIACTCEEEELKAEVFKVTRSQHVPSSYAFPLPTTSREDQVISPHVTTKPQLGAESEIAAIFPQTSTGHSDIEKKGKVLAELRHGVTSPEGNESRDVVLDTRTNIEPEHFLQSFLEQLARTNPGQDAVTTRRRDVESEDDPQTSIEHLDTRKFLQDQAQDAWPVTSNEACQDAVTISIQSGESEAVTSPRISTKYQNPIFRHFRECSDCSKRSLNFTHHIDIIQSPHMVTKHKDHVASTQPNLENNDQNLSSRRNIESQDALAMHPDVDQDSVPKSPSGEESHDSM